MYNVAILIHNTNIWYDHHYYHQWISRGDQCKQTEWEVGLYVQTTQ